MPQLAFAGGQPAADFPQRVCPPQMAEQHADQLTPTGKTARVVFGVARLDDGLELGP
jgi:hypothetical protein